MKEESFKDKCAIFYTIGKCKPFAVMRDDDYTVLEADSVEELIELIRTDANGRLKWNKRNGVWVTHLGRKLFIQNGKMPDGSTYIPKIGSSLSVSCYHPKKGHYSVTYTVTRASEFQKKLLAAKATCDKKIAWRVDDTHRIRDYKGDKVFTTKGGSTIAVTPSGDIISVCKNSKDKASGADLLKFAVAQGGRKLDSFSGNYGFYVKCGFEPVSWTRFNKEYAPHDWKEGVHDEEPVIFFKYTGKRTKLTKDDFLLKVKPCEGENGYDDAMAIRDKSMR